MTELSLKERLDALRQQFPECHDLVFGDLSAGTVLTVSAREDQPQEKMDALLAEAAALLDGNGASIAPLLGGQDGAQLAEASTLSASGLRLHIRTPDAADEALSCHAAPTLDVDGFVVAARSALSGQ